MSGLNYQNTNSSLSKYSKGVGSAVVKITPARIAVAVGILGNIVAICILSYLLYYTISNDSAWWIYSLVGLGIFAHTILVVIAAISWGIA